jgi:hypothetical protein
VRRDAQAVLLLLVGAAMLRLGLGGAYGRYGVNLVLVVATGVAVLAVAAAALWHHLQEGAPAPGAGSTSGRHEAAQEEHELDEGPDRLWSGWLLLLPVLVLLLIVP